MSSDKPRLFQDGRDIFLTLAVMALAMVVTVGATGLCSFNPGAPQAGPVREVDTDTFLPMEARRVAFPVRDPQLPKQWVANSQRASQVAGHQATIVGFVTPEQQFIQVLQTDAPLDQLPGQPDKPRPHEEEKTITSDEAGAVQWHIFTSDDDSIRPTWVADLGDSRLVLEGSANEAEFETFAQAMQDSPVIQVN